MSKYRVYLENVVSYCVDVEAEDKIEAGDLALDSNIPGLMFLDHRYPDTGEWTISEYNGEEQIEELD